MERFSLLFQGPGGGFSCLFPKKKDGQGRVQTIQANPASTEANSPDLSSTRIANRTIPRIAGMGSPEIQQREDQNEWNRSKVESRNVDSESPIRIATYECLAATLDSHDSNRTILNPVLPFLAFL